jgi:hypothetical protein
VRDAKKVKHITVYDSADETAGLHKYLIINVPLVPPVHEDIGLRSIQLAERKEEERCRHGDRQQEVIVGRVRGQFEPRGPVVIVALSLVDIAGTARKGLRRILFIEAVPTA